MVGNSCALFFVAIYIYLIPNKVYLIQVGNERVPPLDATRLSVGLFRANDTQEDVFH